MHGGENFIPDNTIIIHDVTFANYTIRFIY